MTRISFVFTLVLSLLAAPLAPEAQQAGKVARVGIFRPALPSPEGARTLEAFKQGLREQGYVEGQNVAVEFRFPRSTADRLSDIAAEMVRAKPDAILAVSS